MKTRVLIALVLGLAVLAVASATVIGEDGCLETFASSVYQYSQGIEWDGDPVQLARSNPVNALSGIKAGFFSLGFLGGEAPGGWIIVEFDEYVGTCLTVVEQSPGTGYGYPLEQAKVYVSADSETPTNWEYLGAAHNQIAGGSDTGQSHLNVFDLEHCIKFVKIVDTTDRNLFSGNADAFDVDAVGAGPCSTTEVGIDIKPGSIPNCFNVNGHGVIPVAILGSADFDVSQIDTYSLSFGGLAVRFKGKNGPQCSVEDVSGDFITYPEGGPDGYPDLVCQFVDDDTFVAVGDDTATVTGNLLAEFGGTAFTGSDDICLRPE
jgi:hypothetical protein